MNVNYLRKKVIKPFLIACLFVLLIGYINRSPSNTLSTHDVRVEAWNILEDWVAPAELDGNRHTCRKLLNRMERNLTRESLTLGIGATLRLLDIEYSVVEFRNEMRENLSAIRDVFQSCDLVHVLGSIDGADKLYSDDFLSFLSAIQFEELRENGIDSLSLAAPELLYEGIQPAVAHISRIAQTAGIQLTGIVSRNDAVVRAREQTQPLKMLDTSQGLRVGLLSYCALPACEEKHQVTYQPATYSTVSPYDIQLLRAKGARLVLVSVNWGLPPESVSQYSEVVSRQLAMSGANVIVEQHTSGTQGHALYGNTLVIHSAGVMFGRGEDNSRVLTSDFDADSEDVFLFYRIHYGRMGGMRLEYMEIDKKNVRERRGWVEVCGSQDEYCVECVDLRDSVINN